MYLRIYGWVPSFHNSVWHGTGAQSVIYSPKTGFMISRVPVRYPTPETMRNPYPCAEGRRSQTSCPMSCDHTVTICELAGPLQDACPPWDHQLSAVLGRSRPKHCLGRNVPRKPEWLSVYSAAHTAFGLGPDTRQLRDLAGSCQEQPAFLLCRLCYCRDSLLFSFSLTFFPPIEK